MHFLKDHQHGSILPALGWQEAAQDFQFLLPGLTTLLRAPSVRHQVECGKKEVTEGAEHTNLNNHQLCNKNSKLPEFKRSLHIFDTKATPMAVGCPVSAPKLHGLVKGSRHQHLSIWMTIKATFGEGFRPESRRS